MTAPLLAPLTLVMLTTLFSLRPATQEAEAPPPPETVRPVPSSETRSRAAGWGDRSWRDQHEDGRRFLRESGHPNGADLVLLGDSITQSFGGEGRRTGQPGRTALVTALPDLVVANQGISGDRTQHLLWRLENGALAGRNPGFVAVMIGTNNLPHDEGAEIGAGMIEVVRAVRRIAPSSVVLLHAIPPRGTEPDDPMRGRAALANAQARSFAETDPRIVWIDPWPSLLDENDRPRPGFMAGDAVHFGPKGYTLWATRLQEVVRKPRDSESSS